MRRVHIYQVIERLKNRYPVAQLITRIFKKTLKGYRFVCYQLRRQYQLVRNPKTILRYMRILGLRSPIRQKRYQSCTQREINEKARHVHYNVLARNFKAGCPIQKLTTDVSYVYHKQGRMFLSVIKDCYDHFIVAYTLSDFNNKQLVFNNLDLVFNDTWDTTQSCILHSDQGFQYTNQEYLRKLDQYGVTISHSGKGNCYDNASCENFFSHLKSESLRLLPPEDRDSLMKQIEHYIDWYHSDRPQETLKGMTPLEFRKSYLLTH